MYILVRFKLQDSVNFQDFVNLVRPTMFVKHVHNLAYEGLSLVVVGGGGWCWWRSPFVVLSGAVSRTKGETPSTFSLAV